MLGSLLRNKLRGSQKNSRRLRFACMPVMLEWWGLHLLVPVTFPHGVNQMFHYLPWVREMSWFKLPRLDTHPERTAARFTCKNNWIRGENGRQIPSTCLLCCLWHLLTPLSTVLNWGDGPVLLCSWGRVLTRRIIIYGHLWKKEKRKWELCTK